AAEYFKCNCNVVAEEGGEKVGYEWIGPGFGVEKEIKLAGDSTFKANPESVDDCETLQELIKGTNNVFSVSCAAFVCSDAGNEISCEDYNIDLSDFIWTSEVGTTLGTKENPIKVKLGEVVTAELSAEGRENIGFGCNAGCDDDNIIITNNGDNTASLEWDTAGWKPDETKLVAFSIEARDTEKPSDKIITKIFILFEGFEDVVCSNFILNLDCAKTPEACLSACNNESGEQCEFVVGTGKCEKKGTEAPTTPEINTWNKAEQTQYYQGLYAPPPGYAEAGGALPPCAFSGTCRNVNDLVQLIVNFGAGLFAIIGSFAFAFFVYGGFTIVTSFGNAERVKKGKDIMVAAVVGMIIAVSAYLLVEVLLDALKVAPAFRGIK
ncbi:pilin, partial [Patescibacteria group bacterium]|nr:pilin [Patescibacteria group bacterium]